MKNDKNVLEPHHVLESILFKVNEVKRIIYCFWVQVESDRDEYSVQIQLEAKNIPLAALIVRGTPFNDPNSILQDLAILINNNREIFDKLRDLPPESLKNIIILLIARTTLNIPQCSSPITLPEWFPIAPNETHPILIEDLTWQANYPLSCQESMIDEICALLFKLDEEMMTSICRTKKINHNAVNSFIDRIKKQNENLDCIVEKARSVRNSVKNPHIFRPSITHDHFIARLWQLANKTDSDKINSIGEALTIALGVSDKTCIDLYESIFSIIGRPASSEKTPNVRFGRNLLLLIKAACQFVTVSKHADEYNSYPIAIIKTVSQDLRKALTDAIDFIGNSD